MSRTLRLKCHIAFPDSIDPELPSQPLAGRERKRAKIEGHRERDWCPRGVALRASNFKLASNSHRLHPRWPLLENGLAIGLQ